MSMFSSFDCPALASKFANMVTPPATSTFLRVSIVPSYQKGS